MRLPRFRLPSGARCEASGLASHTVISSGGQLTVASGGRAVGTVVNSTGFATSAGGLIVLGGTRQRHAVGSERRDTGGADQHDRELEKAVDLTAMLLGLRAIIFCASSGVCAQGRHGRLPSTSKVFSLARTCPTSKQKRRPQSRPPPHIRAPRDPC
jgi:autotransporter passenger strand-loop-strand repeat protein